MTRRLLHAILIAPLLLQAAACTTNPATGRASFTGFMSPEDERRIGAETHPQAVQEMGGVYQDAKLAAYVDRVGQSIASKTELPNQRFSFTVVDSDDVNAFALPGGYVSVTRGLLALASDEAELASVLAHELGHVTARHAAQRYSQAMTANLGLAALGVAGGFLGLPAGTTDLAGAGAQVYLQSYSRDQEREADELGVRYLTRAGYDPNAMVTFFRKLDAYTRLQTEMAGGDPSADARFDAMASHPRTAEREVNAQRLAAAARRPDQRLDVGPYLQAIDGMTFGDSPSQGFRRGREFAHPELRVAFTVPPGFALKNTPQKVLAIGPDGAAIVFDGERRPDALQRAGSMTNYLTSVWAPRLQLTGVEALQINGMEAATGAARGTSRSGPVDVRLVAIRADTNVIYRFAFLVPPAEYARLSPAFRATAESFRRLSAQEAAELKPLRIEVITARQNDAASALASGLPFGRYNERMFAVMNDLSAGAAPPPGEMVKVVR